MFWNFLHITRSHVPVPLARNPLLFINFSQHRKKYLLTSKEFSLTLLRLLYCVERIFPFPSFCAFKWWRRQGSADCVKVNGPFGNYSYQSGLNSSWRITWDKFSVKDLQHTRQNSLCYNWDYKTQRPVRSQPHLNQQIFRPSITKFNWKDFSVAAKLMSQKTALVTVMKSNKVNEPLFFELILAVIARRFSLVTSSGKWKKSIEI